MEHTSFFFLPPSIPFDVHMLISTKGGLVSEGILTLFPIPIANKKCHYYILEEFQTAADISYTYKYVNSSCGHIVRDFVCDKQGVIDFTNF